MKNKFEHIIAYIFALIVFVSVVMANIGGILDQTDRPQVLGYNESTPIFTESFVMSDYTFRKTSNFPTEESVQIYLESVNSPLKNYKDQGKLASYWIYNAARGITSIHNNIRPDLNPGMILAYLEKEQSLLSLSNYNTTDDKENRIKYAMGYGCPDSTGCSDKYAGFAKQVNDAAYQLELNFQESENGSSLYSKNRTITTLDGFNVFLENSATAAQYRYTPHVYWGNYNLWKIITGNGWGSSDSKYDYSELDAANVAGLVIGQAGVEVTVSKEAVQPELDRTIQIGETSPAISQLQKFLRQEGHFTYAFITGYYGPITDKAKNDYSKSNTTAKTVIGSKCDSLLARSWVIGNASNEVKELQDCLTATGHFSYQYGSTGFFGPVTSAALNEYRGGSPVDSICSVLKNRSWSIGEVSADVTKLQLCLIDEGLYNWPYGATGYFGPYTQGVLNGVSCASEIINAGDWQIGRTGEDVRQLQTCLQNAGIYKWQYGVTGYFGEYTKGLI